jgi:hypothetical protein
MPSSAGARAAALLTLLPAVLAGVAVPAARAVRAVPAAVARAATPPGWRAAVTRHYGPPDDASGFSSVLALGRAAAWAFGGTNPGGAGAPVALQWNGTSWRPAALPAGLGGFIGDASASSAADIWAVSYSDGYVLHWDGSRWLVAKRWHRHSVLTGVTALGPSDVWAFGTTADGQPGLGTWHFDGRSWAQPAGLAQQVYRASAVTPADIWAVAATRQGSFIEHYDGRAWRRGRPPGAGRADPGRHPGPARRRVGGRKPAPAPRRRGTAGHRPLRRAAVDPGAHLLAGRHRAAGPGRLRRPVDHGGRRGQRRRRRGRAPDAGRRAVLDPAA